MAMTLAILFFAGGGSAIIAELMAKRRSGWLWGALIFLAAVLGGLFIGLAGGFAIAMVSSKDYTSAILFQTFGWSPVFALIGAIYGLWTGGKSRKARSARDAETQDEY